MIKKARAEAVKRVEGGGEGCSLRAELRTHACARAHKKAIVNLKMTTLQHAAARMAGATARGLAASLKLEPLPPPPTAASAVEGTKEPACHLGHA